MKSITSSLVRNYRLREVRKACLQNIPEGAISQSVVPVLPALVSFRTCNPIEIHIGDVHISVTDVASPELLKMVLQVAADVK